MSFMGILLLAVFFTTGCSNNNPSNNPSEDNSKNSATSQEANGSADVYTLSQGDLVFFWGQGCPHCENVDQFLADNQGLEEKLKLKKIEVFSDAKGQKLFLEKVKECNLAAAGVPVLYKDGKCTQGDQPIIDELKKDL